MNRAILFLSQGEAGEKPARVRRRKMRNAVRTHLNAAIRGQVIG